jgi:tetratricopeptide (TPR) repeat protein
MDSRGYSVLISSTRARRTPLRGRISMSGDTTATRRYRAFISYSHADAAAAHRLHRALEHYRIPRRLVGGDTAMGPVPRRLAPIFRDREELAAAADLTEHIRDALARSDALIVLCSPAARASPWVAREVTLFREQWPDRPVLAALIDGDPGNAFPESLSIADGAPREPVAADFRPNGDGKRLGRLKLIAGLTGLDLDALVQRDAQRQLRRVTAITLAASLAAIMMAALLVVAIQARREAELQHAKAEGLVEFMLTDLRPRLRKVGRLDVMEAVNRRAIAYYGDASALPHLSDDSLERRARILHAMGEDDQKRGNPARALIWFHEAYAATAATLARHPDDPKAIFAHAQSDYWSALALGTVQASGRDDGAAAEPLFRQATTWFDRAVRARPGDEAALRELANAYAFLGDSYYVRRLWRQSLDTRWAQYRIDRQLLATHPDDVDKVYTLATAERSVGKLSARLGDAATAAAMAGSAYRRSQWLVASDPANAEWRMFDTKVACDLLDIAAMPGVPSTAELRQRITAAVVEFRRQQNPGLADISICVNRVAAVSAAG